MTNALFAVRWAADQIENEWIRPAIGCRWSSPEGEMGIDDEPVREALLEQVLAELTQLVQGIRVMEHRLMSLDSRISRHLRHNEPAGMFEGK